MAGTRGWKSDLLGFVSVASWGDIAAGISFNALWLQVGAMHPVSFLLSGSFWSR